MPAVRRREPGRDQFGHHWENAGDAIEMPHEQVSQLLAEPALPMYSLIEPGATKEVEDGDPNSVDEDSPAGEHERQAATGSRPDAPRLNAPNDNRPEHGSPNTEGSGKSATTSGTPGSLTVGAGDKTAPDGAPGKADTLNTPASSAADSNRDDVPKGKQADTVDGAPNAVDKTIGASGRKGNVVASSDDKK